MAMWNPWRGCRKCSDGCRYCYIHKGDLKRKINTNDIVKTKDFHKPVEKLKDGYDNVVVCCTVENQKNADKKLSAFIDLPIKHKCITAQPLLEKIDIEKYLDKIELVVVGGESDINGRPMEYDWVLNIREQCIRKKVNFEFRQCSTHFIKDKKEYTLTTRDLCRQATLAGIDYHT